MSDTSKPTPAPAKATDAKKDKDEERPLGWEYAPNTIRNPEFDQGSPETATYQPRSGEPEMLDKYGNSRAEWRAWKYASDTAAAFAEDKSLANRRGRVK